MATSGSYNWGHTGTTIIAAALENIGVIEAGGAVASADSAMCIIRLQDIVKMYSGTADGSPGLKIHTRQRVTLFLAEGQQTYLIGPASGDARSTTRYGRTTIDAAEAAEQTVISVTATTDTTTEPGTSITATASDIIGVEQNDGTIFWDTVASISAGDTITMNNGLDVAAAVGNYVWYFTSRAQRLIAVESAVLRDENRTDTPLTIYSDAREYDQGVSDKYADGDPTAILVEPLRITTRITLDTQPTDVTKTIVLTGWYPGEDMDAAANDVSFPQEALRFLTWELAFEVCDGYGVTWTASMEKKRQEARSTYLNLNPETSVLYFQSAR